MQTSLPMVPHRASLATSLTRAGHAASGTIMTGLQYTNALNYKLDDMLLTQSRSNRPLGQSEQPLFQKQPHELACWPAGHAQSASNQARQHNTPSKHSRVGCRRFMLSVRHGPKCSIASVDLLLLSTSKAGTIVCHDIYRSDNTTVSDGYRIVNYDFQR